MVSLLPVAGCDKASPVAPNGTILAVTANPSQVGLTGTSTITIVGRKPDGTPLNPGTEIRLTSDIGTITSTVTTDSSGDAAAIFHADGRAGTATITATAGGGMATAKLQVGQSTDQKPTVLITVSPNNIPVKGTATVTLIVRNSDGSPAAAGQIVIVTTTLGTITDPRPKTKGDGTATTMLSAGDQAGTASVSAVFGSSDAAKQDVTIRDAAADISIQANPSSIPVGGGTITLTAFVTNSQGLALQGAPVKFASQKGTLATTGAVFTDTTGVATTTLTTTQSQLAGVPSFMVSAATPIADGTQKTVSTTITVSGGS